MPSALPLRVAMADPAREYELLRDELEPRLLGLLRAGQLTGGEEVAGLEQSLAARMTVAHAVGTASGTMALVIALRALNIGPGDEVITAAYNSICPACAITLAGAEVRLADVTPETLTLDAATVAQAITPHTRAIIVVHLHGYVAEMDGLLRLAEEHNLVVIEDAALALGAAYRKRAVGSLGQAAAVSFAPSKILGGLGWGGMLFTNDSAVASRARMIAGFGPPPLEYAGHADDREGYNAQLSPLLAAGLRVKHQHLDTWLARRRAIAARYDAACDTLGVQRLRPPACTTPSYRAYVIRVAERDRVLARLAEAGVEASPHFIPPLHLRPVYARLGYQQGDFPEAERACRELICLPVHPLLLEAEVDHVINALTEAVA